MNLTIFSPIGVRNLTDRQLLVNLTGRDQRVTTGDSWPTFPFLLCVTYLIIATATAASSPSPGLTSTADRGATTHESDDSSTTDLREAKDAFQ